VKKNVSGSIESMLLIGLSIAAWAIIMDHKKGEVNKTESKKGNTVVIHNNSGTIGNVNNTVNNEKIEAKKVIAVVKDKCKAVSKISINFLKENGLAIGASTIATIYGYIIYQILKGNRYLNRSDTWGAWKEECSLEELNTIDHSELASELIDDIQLTYMDPEKPVDFVCSLTMFLNDIDKEIEYVKYLSKIKLWVDRTYTAVILPIKKDLWGKRDDYLERLTLIRTVFLKWAAQYKIDQNRRFVVYI